MTTSTAPCDGRRRRRGFSLTEVIIGMSLSVIVLSGVLSAFLMLGRSGMNAAHYSMAEAEIRRGVEEFSQDVRMASGITWNGTQSLTLTLVAPNAYSSLTGVHTNKVTYAYDSSGGTFYRLPGASTSTSTRLTLVRNVSTLSFICYNRGDDYLDPTRSPVPNFNSDTKRIQLTMNVRRTGQTLVAANTTVVMASFILRNKAAN